MAQANNAAPYGSKRRNQSRERASSSMKTKVDRASRPMVYFDSSPNPKHTPAHHHASRRPASSARSRKYRVPAHAAVSGASGVMSNPARKKNGSACISATAASPAGSPNRLRARGYMNHDAMPPQGSAPMRTPNSLLPNTLVPALIIHPTIGGWSR